jgi:plasmid stability protein
MAMLTVRNLPDDVHRALRLLAKSHGQSTEAEVRQILANAVNPPSRIKMGQALAAIGLELGVSHQDIEAMEAMRQQKPAKPMSLE